MKYQTLDNGMKAGHLRTRLNELEAAHYTNSVLLLEAQAIYERYPNKALQDQIDELQGKNSGIEIQASLVEDQLKKIEDDESTG
jgi:hypothetical protein